ncbi:hypothetical protein JTE90_006721 [Oedothorax gibbosus]|uniref:Uncharacterized protein n=1 Tax=Oedothorax gibbosus TaxID=931172 RepID=A0AAV6TGH4_9ARAC|nr:hypothetical protein JTE90_006721 [Oedothorax gibbosus]
MRKGSDFGNERLLAQNHRLVSVEVVTRIIWLIAGLVRRRILQGLPYKLSMVGMRYLCRNGDGGFRVRFRERELRNATTSKEGSRGRKIPTQKGGGMTKNKIGIFETRNWMGTLNLLRLSIGGSQGQQPRNTLAPIAQRSGCVPQKTRRQLRKPKLWVGGSMVAKLKLKGIEEGHHSNGVPGQLTQRSDPTSQEHGEDGKD